MSGLKGAAGGPPNPNGPRGARAYRREGRKRDCPPGARRATLAEGALTQQEMQAQYQYQAMKSARLSLAYDSTRYRKFEPSTLYPQEMRASVKVDGRGRTIRIPAPADVFWNSLSPTGRTEPKAATEADTKLQQVAQQLEAYRAASMAVWRGAVISGGLAELPAPGPLEPCIPLRLVASYMARGVMEPHEVEARARQALEGLDFDTLVGRGLSGALVVPTLARALGKRWAIVRKEGDGSHSSNRYEGCCGTRWLFVDDLVGSGETLCATAKAIWAEFARACVERPVFVGAFIYTLPVQHALVPPGGTYLRNGSRVR